MVCSFTKSRVSPLRSPGNLSDEATLLQVQVPRSLSFLPGERFMSSLPGIPINQRPDKPSELGAQLIKTGSLFVHVIFSKGAEMSWG